MATAGVTTVLDSLCVGTAGLGVRSFAVVEQSIDLMTHGSAAAAFRCDHMLHLRAEISNPEMVSMFERVYRHPLVKLVSLMDHTPGQRQWADLERYVAMEKKDYGLSAEEIDSFLKDAQERHEQYSARNRASVLGMILGEGSKRIALASHDDTTVAHVEEALSEGITISEFPTTLEAAKAARKGGMQIVAGSPNVVLRKSHSGNVAVEALAQEGLLDTLSSDYAPGSLLHAAFLLATILERPLHETLELVTVNPARMVSLEDRGRIASGLRGDLIRVREIDGMPYCRGTWVRGLRVA